VNEYNLALFGLDTSSEIIGFNDGRFRSFTFHYNDAVAVIRTNEDSRGHFVHFGFRETGGETGEFRTQFWDLLENYPNMKIALLDYAGNVISVSARFSLPRPRRGVWITNWADEGVSYNHESGMVIVHLRPVRYNCQWQ